MNSKEIAIGNWIMYDSNACVIQSIIRKLDNTYSVELYQVKTKSCLKVDLNDIAPIPISEDLLSKNGFDVAESNENYKILYDSVSSIKLTYMIQSNHWTCIVFDDFGMIGRLEGIKYIHQLQNLFSAVGFKHKFQL